MSNVHMPSVNTTITITPTNSTAPEQDEAFYLTKVISYASVSVLIIAGNLLCLVVFLRTPQMRRKRAYYLLVSLSIADALVGISCAERTAQMRYPAVANENSNTFSVLNFLASPASLFTLSAISIERFIATVFPLRHRIFGVLPYAVLLGVPWASAAVIFMIVIFTKLKVLPSVWVTYTRITIPIPLLIIFICYTALVAKLKYGSRVMSVGNGQLLRDRKLAITLLIVTLLSLITWVPFGVYVEVLNYCVTCKEERYARDLYLVLNCLKGLNSAINVVVYMFRMPDFKRGVGKIVPGRQQNMS
ncbi:probable G-protein coupled receptor 21 [Nematostella vectensis]|uniref:probable G-protein coupled receptor 21 n=1 Tax=Nematostella vectensis TaxID=45351 RepID=UPI002076DC3C|nr:probable G-protein coupled receptor 21 [Nematostella vectensis]XP_048578689.1 probable G-protein coupled receptor 21 [Nematostella vectensis]XP_048578690.1 probable G-protein coupled receptor 21 [Nematostella vectensis]